MVRLEVDARLRRGPLRVPQPAILDQEILGADDTDPLPMVGVAVDTPDHHIPIGARFRRGAQVDAVPSRLLDGQVLNQHVSTAGEDQPVPPFGFRVGVGLVIGLLHAKARSAAAGLRGAANGDMMAFPKRQQAVPFRLERAFQSYQFRPRLEDDFLIAHTAQRPRHPGRRLPVDDEPLDVRVEGVLQELGRVVGIEPPPRRPRLLAFAVQDLPNQRRPAHIRRPRAQRRHQHTIPTDESHQGSQPHFSTP